MTSPRVVIGAPLYNHAADLPETIESLLTQSYREFTLVCVDDQSSDATGEIVESYAARDSRIVYVRNAARLGMIDNWRLAFNLALEQSPDAAYFAWASDHDVWHPRWLRVLVDVLDRHPEVVLAYPRNRRIGPEGAVIDKRPWQFDTAGVEALRVRFRRTMSDMSAGNMIYGLGRSDAIRRAGVFRRVLVPDRLLLMELSLEGQFRQVPEVLWFRRKHGQFFSLQRQRHAFFPNGRPLYAYVPWWISHASALTWILGVRAARAPRIGRWAGFRLGGRYLRLAGLLHFRQELKAFRIELFERATFLKPIYVRCRNLYRGLTRRTGLDALSGRLSKSFGEASRRRRLVRLVKRKVRTAANEAIGSGRYLLRAVRALPLMKSRVIPWLVRQEIDEVPAGREVGLMKRALRTVVKSRKPIIVGPWLSEVGFEVLYWIPFLTWAVKEFDIDRDQLIVVSRGGADAWYRDLAEHYEDIFDLMSVKDYRHRNEERWSDGGNQKQMAPSAFDDHIVDLVKAKRGLSDVAVLHPSVMYRLFRYFWYGKGAISLLEKHTVYRPMPAIDRGPALEGLPAEYAAVRFYFRPSFPDSAENRALIGQFVQALARRMPVVLLNPGLSLDDHEDFDPGTGMGVHKIDHLMTPTTNLQVQSAVIAHARAFVGTYGGLSYLGPFYGVPSIGLFSYESELVATHLDISRRLSRRLAAPLVTLDIREVAMVEMLFDTLHRDSGTTSAPRAPVAPAS